MYSPGSSLKYSVISRESSITLVQYTRLVVLLKEAVDSPLESFFYRREEQIYEFEERDLCYKQLILAKVNNITNYSKPTSGVVWKKRKKSRVDNYNYKKIEMFDYSH